MDAEVRRLKNRVRQQRYRARKREEKAKMDSYVCQGDQNACHGSLPQCLPLLGMSNVVNGLPALNMGAIYAKPIQENNQTRHPGGSDNCGNETRGYADHGYGGIEKCSEGSDSHPRERSRQQQTVGIPNTVVQGDGDTSHGSYHPSIQAPKVLQTLTKMENGHHVNTLIKHGHSKSHYDIMARRLKNRERQRRYRSRKRLEADVKSADLGNQSTSLQSHKSGVVGKPKPRVRHHRDWKKDARQAHILKEPIVASIETPAPALSLASEPAAHDMHDQVKAPFLEGAVHLEPPVSASGYEANDSTHGRRHWKAAARNKVDCSLQELLHC